MVDLEQGAMDIANQADPDNLWYLLVEAHKHLEA